jgi:hypothetical protein
VVKSLDKATGLDKALSAAREWTFARTLDGKPVPMIVGIALTFSLR